MQPPTSAPNFTDARASLRTVVQGAALLDYLLSYDVPEAQRRVEEAILASPSHPCFPVTLVDCDQETLEPYAARQRKKRCGFLDPLTAHLEPDGREGREGQQRVALRCGFTMRFRNGAPVFPDEPAEGTLIGYVNDADQPWVAGLLKGGFHGFILHRLTGRRPNKRAVVMLERFDGLVRRLVTKRKHGSAIAYRS